MQQRRKKDTGSSSRGCVGDAASDAAACAACEAVLNVAGADAAELDLGKGWAELDLAARCAVSSALASLAAGSAAGRGDASRALAALRTLGKAKRDARAKAAGAPELVCDVGRASPTPGGALAAAAAAAPLTTAIAGAAKGWKRIRLCVKLGGAAAPAPANPAARPRDDVEAVRGAVGSYARPSRTSSPILVVSAEDPRRGRGGAVTRLRGFHLHGISTSWPRR